jgi:hypothetical protein
MTMYAVLPQNLGTFPNLTLSLSSWLNSQVKVPYDTASLALGLSQGYVYDQKTSLWSSDTKGLGLMECEPDDPSLFERSPTVSYCVGDGRNSKPSRSTGVGDRAVWEWHPACIAVSPAVKVSTTGTAEPDHFSDDFIRTYLYNATSRTLTLPLLDLAQPVGGGTSYVQIGFAYIENVTPSKVQTVSQKTSQVVTKQRRFELEFELKICVETTNG